MRSRLKAIVAVLCTLALAVTPTFAAWGDDENDASSGEMTAKEQTYATVGSGKRIDTFKLTGANSTFSYESLGNDSGKTTLTLSTSALQKAVKEKLLPQWSPVAASIFRDQAGQLVDLYGYYPSNGNMSQVGFDAYFNVNKGVKEYKDEKWSCYNLSSKLGQTYASHDGDPGWDQFIVSGVKQVNSLSGARNMVGQALYDSENHKGLKADEFLGVDEGNGATRLDELDDDNQTTGFANVVTSVNCKGASSNFDYVTFGIVFYDFEPVPVAAKKLKYVTGEFTSTTNDKGNSSSVITNGQQQEIVHSALLGDSVTETTSTTLSGLASFKMSENIGANISWGETESTSETESWSDDDFFGTGSSTSTSSETTTMGLNWGTAWEMAGALGAEVGHSKSVEVSKAVETTIALPPHTATTIDHSASTTTYTQGYQQPAILNYKVAIFATSGDFYSGGDGGINPSEYDKQSLVIKFDTKDDAAASYGCVATDDLNSRVGSNIDVKSYDISGGRTYSTHSSVSGWKKSEDINWSEVIRVAQDYYSVDVANTVAKKNFFFESPGKLNVDKDKSTSATTGIYPLKDLASVKTPKTNYVLYTGSTLDSKTLTLQGYDTDGVPFYGFDANQGWGQWKLCDENGDNTYEEPKLSDPVEYDASEEALKPRENTEGGTIYLTWVFKSDAKPKTGDSPNGQNLAQDQTDGKIATPVVRIDVKNAGLENPSITAEGSYTGYYGASINLNNVMTYRVTDDVDRIIEPQVKWESQEPSSYGINVNGDTGNVTFTKHGTYHVRPYVINNNGKAVYPKTTDGKWAWLTVTATEHNFVHCIAKAPTCEVSGWKEHYTCPDCGKYFSSADDSAEIPASDVTLDATGHDWGEWSTTQEASGATPGKQQRVCKNDASHVEEREVYTVQFDMREHGTAPEKQTVVHRELAKSPQAPADDGYLFEGWFTDEDYNNPFDFGTPVTSNLTLYAKWAPVKYTVATMAVGDVYVDANGEEKVDPYAHGSLGIGGDDVTTATETEGDYTYTYNYKEVKYGDTVTLTVTPDANYSLKKIQAVPFNSDSSTGEPFEPTKKETDPVTHTVTYTFTMPAADVAVVASFRQEKVTVTYAGNKPEGASEEVANVPEEETIDYGKTPTNISATPTLAEYDFGGWFTNSECTKPCLKTAAITGNTTLYAKWTQASVTKHKVEYTLQYEPDPEIQGDTGSYTESYTVESDDAKAYDPTNDLYDVAGKDLTGAYELKKAENGTCWFTDETCTTAYDFNAPVTSDLHLYATVVPRTYTVTYFDSEKNLGTQDVAYGAAIGALGITAPAKEGYTLSGWTTRGAEWKIESDSVKSNLDLYASWTTSKYSVTFDANGQGSAPAKQEVIHGNQASDPGALKAEGYTFGGWFSDKACTKAYDFATPVKADTTLYAKWTKNTADISKAQVTLEQTSVAYDGKAKEPAVKSVVLNGTTLQAGKDFTVSYKNNVNAGTATVTVTGTGDYTGSASATFAITEPAAAPKTSLANAQVTLDQASLDYDGKAKEPAVQAVVLDGKTLQAGVDYAVSYSNNVNLGTAVATVTGIGSYEGAVNATFAIALGKPNLSTVVYPRSSKTMKAKWAKVPGAKKYQLQYKVRGGKWKTVTLKGKSKVLKSLKTGKLYDVRVRAVAGKVKSAWSPVAHRWFVGIENVAATSTKAGTVKATWKKVSKANAGYQVIVRYSKKGAIVAKKTVKSGKKSATIKGLTPGKKAWVEVRPLRKAGKTTYSGELRRAKSSVKVASQGAGTQSVQTGEASGLRAASL